MGVMNRKEKVINAAATVLLVTAVVMCITVIAQILSKGYVTMFGTSLFRVVTGSMEPTISTGALLISREVDIDEVEEGDIVCFRSMESNMLGQVITHRVVDIVKGNDGETYLETRGDANPASDGYYVMSDNLIGEVSAYTKEGNILAKIYAVVTSPLGFLSCIVFPILLVAGFIMQGSVNVIRKELDVISQGIQDKPAEPAITQEEYEQMVERLRKEVLEEVKQSVEQAGEKR